MNLDIIKEFFTEYSAYCIVVSIVCGVLFYVLDKPLDKCPKIIKSYMPMLFSILAIILLDYFFIKENFVLKESFAVGVFSGSLSYAVTSFFRRKVSGSSANCSVLELTLTEILNDFTDSNSASEIAKEIILKISETSSPKTVVSEQVLNTRFKESLEPNSLVLLKSLVAMALTSLKQKS